MTDSRCSFCFRTAGEMPKGVLGAHAYICGSCIARAVAVLVEREGNNSKVVHPATIEFLQQFAAFRDQMERGHSSREDHLAAEVALERLEAALLAVRELVTPDAE